MAQRAGFSEHPRPGWSAEVVDPRYQGFDMGRHLQAARRGIAALQGPDNLPVVYAGPFEVFHHFVLARRNRAKGAGQGDRQQPLGLGASRRPDDAVELGVQFRKILVRILALFFYCLFYALLDLLQPRDVLL